MEQTTASKMNQFEKFLESIDSFYKDNGKCFWLTLKKETYVRDTESIRDKISELELNGIEVGEPRENLLTLGVTYCIEIRRM